MTASLILEWGLQPPTEALAAWGARGIPSGRLGEHIDLLPDRQSYRGDSTQWSALEKRLNGEDTRAYLPGFGALRLAQRAWAKGPAFSDRYSGEVFPLYADGEVEVQAAWRGGYVMMGAWLTKMPEAVDPEVHRAWRIACKALGADHTIGRKPGDVENELRRGRPVRFGAVAVVPELHGALYILAADPYTPRAPVERLRKPRPPAQRTYTALRDFRDSLDHVERENRKRVEAADEAEAAGWLAARPTILARYPADTDVVRGADTDVVHEVVRTVLACTPRGVVDLERLKAELRTA